MTSRDTQLAELGWRDFYRGQLSAEEIERLEPVRVMAIHRGKMAVAGAGAEQLVTPDIQRRDEADSRPAVGDWLLIDPDTLQPIRILRRASLFQRRPPGKGRKLQLIAANVDTLFIVASCNEDFNLARIERYLVLAREVGVHPIVVLTKADLAGDPEEFAEAAGALQPGLEVSVVNARDPLSVAPLAAKCGPGETVALLGSSGVGKSTLINTLRGSKSIATQEVRQGDGKGRHTTTVREMHRLANGGWLLDTPGMREFQLSDAEEGIEEVFNDILALARECKFSNCSHEGEPKCAVQSALKSGELSAARLDRWRKLAAEETNRPGPATGRNRARSFDKRP